MRYEELVTGFVEELRTTGRSPHYCQEITNNWLVFADWCLDQNLANPADILPEHLESWMMKLQWTPSHRGRLRADTTVLDKMRMVTACFTWAHERNLLLADPGLYLRLPRPVPKQPASPLTSEQVAKLLDAPSPFTAMGRRDRAVLAVFYDAALRLGECERLDVADVDFKTRLLTIRKAKNGHARMAPIGDGLARRLEEYLVRARPRLLRDRPDDGALFLSKAGVRLSHQSTENVVVAACRKAGLARAGPHALRHACASHMVANGAPIDVVQRILGHRSLSSTYGYTRLMHPDVVAEFRRTHPRAVAPAPGA